MKMTRLPQYSDVFEKYDADKDNVISINELQAMFSEISSKLTSLPAVRVSLFC